MEFRSSRTRSKANEHDAEQQEDRKDHQMQLHKLRKRDLRLRFEKGEIQCTENKKKVKDMSVIQAYRSPSQYPKDLVPGKIYVDSKNFAVLIPNSQTTWIPIHISTIKSVSDQITGDWTFLRINFHISGGKDMKFPPMEDPENIWMKYLTMKTHATNSNNRLSQASKAIKECMKQLKAIEQEKDNKGSKSGADSIEQVQTIKTGRKEVLENLVIRPNLVGRKTIGTLEIHVNGLRFISTKGQKVDVPFSNVKNFFHQPCASDELIVILHFHLHKPIMLNDKPAKDI